MIDLEKVAYIQGQVACVLIEMEAMKVANKEKLTPGVAYGEDAFLELMNKYMVSHNAILGYLYH